MKFKLICHPSGALLDFKKIDTLKEWGFQDREIKKVHKVAEAGASVLFGTPPVSIITIENLKHLKEVVEELEKNTNSNKKIKADNGLIILTDAAANSTKKLTTLVEKLGGEVDNTTKSTSTKNDNAIISELKLSKEVETFLIEYAGQEAGNLVTVLKVLSDIPQAQRRRVGVDDVLVRLPLPAGSLPPWDLEKPLFAKDVNKSIITYRRIAGKTGPLLALWNLNDKFQKMYKAAFLLKNQAGIKDEEIIKILKISNPNVYKYGIKPQVSKLGVDKLEKIVKIIIKLDSDIKSGATKSDVRFEIGLVEIIEVIKSY